MTTWRGYELTDPPMVDDPALPRRAANWHAIELLREKLHDKYDWAKTEGASHGNVYDKTTAKLVYEFKTRTGLPVTVDEAASGYGIANLATRQRLGSYPPPAPPRHAALCFIGTGGIIGLDYVDRVADACSGLVERIDVVDQATMGMAPVGAATDFTAPSGYETVDLMVENAVAWVLANPNRTIVLIGYSLGAIGLVKFLLEFAPGGRLAQFIDNIVCIATFGNPARTFGHTFYLGPVPSGEGISDVRATPELLAHFGWRWCDCVQPGDLYANTTGGPDVLKICRDAYNLVMGQQIHDPIALMTAMLPLMLQTASDAGITLPPNIPAIGLGAFLGLLKALGINVPATGGTAAAVQAAFEGIKFATSNPPTAPHITYEFAEAIPGKTYLELAIQHVTYWATEIPVKV